MIRMIALAVLIASSSCADIMEDKEASVVVICYVSQCSYLTHCVLYTLVPNIIATTTTVFTDFSNRTKSSGLRPVL